MRKIYLILKSIVSFILLLGAGVVIITHEEIEYYKNKRKSI